MNNNGTPQNLSELYQTVGEIKGKVDTMYENLNAIIRSHEKRINDVEKNLDTLQGKAIGAGAIGGAIIATLSFLKKWFE